MLTNTNIIYKQKRYSIGFGKHRLFEHFNKKLLLYLDKSIPFICPFFSTDDVCGVRDKIFCKVQFRHQRTWTLNNEQRTPLIGAWFWMQFSPIRGCFSNVQKANITAFIKTIFWRPFCLWKPPIFFLFSPHCMTFVVFLVRWIIYQFLLS